MKLAFKAHFGSMVGGAVVAPGKLRSRLHLHWWPQQKAILICVKQHSAYRSPWLVFPVAEFESGHTVTVRQ